MNRAGDILELASALIARGEPFALATVVRTHSATAAKAGAKAVILPDGTISGGWIGGGCARAATLKAAKEALAEKRSRLISVQPGDALAELGVQPGEEREGVAFAKNSCASQGTMDIFIEPVLPRPELVICGSSPVAVALSELGRRLGFAVTVCVPSAEQAAFECQTRIEGYTPPASHQGSRYIVVSTQGRGDEAALSAALAVESDYIGFVGSKRKAQALKAKLRAHGGDPARIATLHAPAGLDLGAITPEEIALSILAEIVAKRRKGQSKIENNQVAP